jgi:hypothetical protein
LLGESIALIAVAALFGVEAWKANGGFARLVLTVLAVLFALSGVFLKFLADAIPRAGEIVAETFSQPVAWFVLMMAVFLVLRPFWSGSKETDIAPAQSGRNLGIRAGNVATRLGLHRGRYSIIQEVRDPLPNVINDGISLLISFEKQGFGIPKLSRLSTNEQAAFALLEYFTRMSPLLRDGHFDEAKHASPSIAKQAVSAALTLQQGWS